MSEHQIYDFRSIDRTLTSKERTELRAISTRATITASSFHNEYHWGDLKGDPAKMVATYFDAFFYLTNWGTRRLIFKFPSNLVEVDDLTPYSIDYRIDVWEERGHTLLDIHSRVDDGFEEYWHYTDALDDFISLREQILNGDHRALYMIWIEELSWYDDPADWLASVEDIPSVPDGLGELDSALSLWAEMFELDMDVIESAAKTNPSEKPEQSTSDVERVLSKMTATEKDALLKRVAAGDPQVRAELLAQSRRPSTAKQKSTSASLSEVTSIIDKARAIGAAKEKAELERREQERAERAHRKAAAREKYLKELAEQWEEKWDDVCVYIDQRKREDYAEASKLMAALLEAVTDDDVRLELNERIAAVREEFSRRSALMEEMDKRLGR